jgi:hypothetical protein
MAFLLAFDTVDQKALSAKEPMILTGKSMQSETFNISYKKWILSYYQLKEQFIAEKATFMDASAKQVMISIDNDIAVGLAIAHHK